MAANYLFEGEEAALVVRPHPVVLVKPALAPLAAIALVSAMPNRFTAIVLLIIFGRFAWDVGIWWSDRYVVTTERIISMSGIVTKKVVSLPLPKITDLTYARSFLGRIFGYGSMDLESAGQRDFGRIDFLPHPDNFYRAIMALALGVHPHGQSHDGEIQQVDDGTGDIIELDIDDKDRFYDTAEVPVVRRIDD